MSDTKQKRTHLSDEEDDDNNFVGPPMPLPAPKKKKKGTCFLICFTKRRNFQTYKC